MTELPKGWCRAKLDELFEMTGGGTPSTDEPTYWGKGFPWITSADIDSSSNYTVRKEVTPRGVEESATNVVGPNTVLVVSRVGLGKVALSQEHLCYSQDVQGLPVNADCFDPRFVKVQLSFLMEALKYEGRGTTIKGLTKTQLKNTFFSFPPLKEQRRIVEKIGAKFEEIDAGTQSLRAAQAKLGLYRQSLLKSAFEGRLTADWRAQNPDKLEDPETLLSRIQSERDTRYKAALDDWQKSLTQWREDGEQGKKPAKPKRPEDVPQVELSEANEIGSIPVDWTWVRPSLIADPRPYSIGIGPFGSNLKVPDYRDKGVPLVFVRNITKEDFSLGQKYVSNEKAKELDAHSIEGGDVLVTKMGDPPGDCTVYPDNGPYAIITADCLKFRVWRNFADRNFIAYMIRCNAVRRQLGLITQGVAQKKISVARFKTIALPLPSFAEQTEIVRILDAKLEAADALEAEITAALTRADALRQSILKKAFSGRLVPQDPTDEPASALLNRIKADRAAAPKAKRTRKTSA